MKLVTNCSNPEALKVFIAAELSGKQINVEIIEKNEGKNLKRFPQVILDNGEKVFSSNAAVKYLMSPVDNSSTVNYFLDLEAGTVQPLVSSRGLKCDGPLMENLCNELNKLNNVLSKSKYLSGDTISAADISLWATLFYVAIEEGCLTGFFSKFQFLKEWFTHIQDLPEVIKVTGKYKMSTDGLDCLRAGHWFPNRQIDKILGDSNSVNAHDGDDRDDRSKESVSQVSEGEIKLASEGWSNEAKRELPKKAADPVLPVPGERNILVTSALPYVNNVPHLGNIIGCVLSGDVFARYCRLRNYNTIHICGTDEYGTATETKALEENLTPKQICDKYFEIHDRIYKWFNIEFDRFGRTTTPEQTEISQQMFLKLYQNGFILSDSVEQLLCEKCDRYLADRFVEGTCPRCLYDDARGDQCDGCGHLINATELLKPRCKMCQATPVLRHSKQFFLDLPKVEPVLKEWMEKSSKNWSHNAREISRAWLNDGLKSRCITRDLKWGVPVPLKGYENKVFYVWFDAPIGYMSITKQYTERWKEWWMRNEETDVKLYQFMAKDNVPFHSVLFPSSLIGSGEDWILVENIFATEYLNYEDGKFSKSRGIGVFGTDAQDTGIPPDIWRFYLLYVRPESQDSSFSWNDLALKNNSELLNILGNFINRALIFTEKNYQSIVPEMNLTAEDFKTVALINRELTDYISCLEKGKLRDGLRRILSIARTGNLLMQTSQPWVHFKGNPEEQKRAGTVIGLCINLSCLLSVLLKPYMPQTSDIIQKQLNADRSVNLIEDAFRLILKPGHKIGKPSPLFTKIEIDMIEKLKSRFSGRQRGKTPDEEEKAEAVGSDANSIEAAAIAQGNKVRQMKASGMSKSEWQPQVAILLDLKKKLEAAKAKKTGQTSEIPKANFDSKSGIEEIAKAIEEQGNVVRKLKESGVERSRWQPELNKLLDLKKKLAELKGEPIATTDKKGKKGK